MGRPALARGPGAHVPRSASLALALVFACGSSEPPRRPFTPTTAVSSAAPLAAGCEGVTPGAQSTAYLGSAVEPSVAAHPRDRQLLLGAWQQDRWTNGGARGVVAATSSDGGRSWRLGGPAFSRCTGGSAANGGDYERASDPWVSVAPDGTLHAIALAFDREGPYVQALLASRSTDGGETWSHPVALVRDTDPDFAPDKETLTADPNDARLVYATWDRLTGQSSTDPTLQTGPLWFARSTDGGATWEPPRQVYDPGKNAQTIGAQVLVLPGGALLLGATVLADLAAAAPSGVTLVTLRSEDGGVSWSAPAFPLAASTAGALDPKSRRAIRSSGFLFALAVDPGSGAVYATWEDARFSSGAGPGVALARSDDGGGTFGAPVKANGAAAEAFDPVAAVARSGEVAVLYYDLRDDDAGDPARLGARAWLARSRDGGASFTEAALGDLFDLRAAPFSSGLFLGDYQGLAAADDAFLPFFARAGSDGTRVVTVPW
jgi:hypothetical protein